MTPSLQSGKYNPQHVTAQCDAPPVVTDQEVDAARRTVASHCARAGLGAVDAAEFMRMLGIHPGEVDEFFVTGPSFLQQCDTP